MPDEISKYQNEWEDFQNWEAVGCVTPILLFGCIFGAAALLRFLTGADDSIQKVIPFAVLLVMIMAIFLTVKKTGWKCPRCGKAFDPRPRRRSRFCRSCGLPKYYGSSYYFDNWGTAKGNEMARKIERGEL